MAGAERSVAEFSQTWRGFGQVGPFRRNAQSCGHNDLSVQEIASGCRPFPDEEGTESPTHVAPRSR